MSLIEIAVIILVALILFGPEDLPKFARALGKILSQLRRYTNELGGELINVLEAPGNIVNEALKYTAAEQKGRQSKGGLEDTEEFLKYDDDTIISAEVFDKQIDEDLKKDLNS